MSETKSAEAGVTDDAKVFLESDIPVRIRLVDGNEHQIPKISFKREQIVLRVIGETISTIWNSDLFRDTASVAAKGGGVSDLAQAALLGLLFEQAPDKLAKIAAAICGKDEEWVGDNLDSESILELILPFLKHRQTRIVAALSRLTGNFPAAVAAVKAVLPAQK